ncbi:hypothetical protein N7512_002280 [Penicillium capsulatum]|nr:hypothetical protein N7512_002280 [Penicillium capsulatum]
MENSIRELEDTFPAKGFNPLNVCLESALPKPMRLLSIQWRNPRNSRDSIVNTDHLKRVLAITSQRVCLEALDTPVVNRGALQLFRKHGGDSSKHSEIRQAVDADSIPMPELDNDDT